MNERWILSLLAAVALAACTQKRYTQKGSSMSPTIQPKDTIIADSKAYSSKRSPQRWEIIVFHPPNEPTAVYAMRVVGLPGERIHVTDRGLLIDGQVVQPPAHLHAIRYLLVDRGLLGPQPTTESIVPSDSYFVVGDNSAHANDSRSWGSVPRSSIIGKVTNKN